MRKKIWGYVPEETLSNDVLIREKYQGIRPAPGYATYAEYTEKNESGIYWMLKKIHV